jgi:RNA polymerase sigma-70 factor (ECF subfamily)
MAEPADDVDRIDSSRLGRDSVAGQVFNRYADRLIALARRRISQRLSTRVDPEDIVQSVFRTFFQHARAGEFRIEDQDDLSKLLVRITVHKTLRQVAFHKAAKRNVALEAGQSAEAQSQLDESLDREPTPEEAVAFIDHLEHFLNLFSPQERTIIEMRMRGYTNDEIVLKLGISSDRKIRRIMERVREKALREGLSPEMET